MDKKLKPRLISSLILFPVLVFLVFWEKGQYFLLVIILVSLFGSIEVAQMLQKKGLKLAPYWPVLYGLFFPVIACLEVIEVLSTQQTMAVFVFFVMFIFLRQIFTKTEKEFEFAIKQASENLFMLIYPGFFLYFYVKILHFDQASLLILILGLAICVNDINSWLWGNLFGRRSFKPFLVSPQKSLIGFIGGAVGTFLILTTAFFLFPGLLGRNFIFLLALAFLLTLVSIVGDLFESSLKRSCQVKDSGFLIPGRGGILDSCDSHIFSAPIFQTFLMYQGE